MERWWLCQRVHAFLNCTNPLCVLLQNYFPHGVRDDIEATAANSQLAGDAKRRLFQVSIGHAVALHIHAHTYAHTYAHTSACIPISGKSQ